MGSFFTIFTKRLGLSPFDLRISMNIDFVHARSGLGGLGGRGAGQKNFEKPKNLDFAGRIFVFFSCFFCVFTCL